MDDLEKSVNKSLISISSADGKTVRCIGLEDGKLIIAFDDGTFCFFESRNGCDGGDSSINDEDYIPIHYDTQSALVDAGIITSQQYTEHRDKQSAAREKANEEFRERTEKADFLRLKAKYEPVVADTASA